MPTISSIPDDAAAAFAHGDEGLPLVVCDDCGCVIVPQARHLKTHDRVCPGHLRPRPLTDLARRVLGIKP